MIYNPAEQHWDDFANWKTASNQTLTPLYLQANMGLGFTAPAAGAAYDEYISDPTQPVPFRARPIQPRFVADRSDVLSYVTPVLTKGLKLEGAPIADLFASTTGTDGDFVVKLIDVYPATDANDPEMGGYQLAVAIDIFRGRYRKSFSDPTAIPANVTFVPSIFEAKPGDYQKATQRVYRSAGQASYIALPVIGN
ncbi:MAG: hypothetical protein WDW38_006429 [Sanguina aurantia]